MEEDNSLSEVTESFGEYLRRHREASGKAVEEIAQVTRISKRYLEAFEANDIDNLPEDAFARGFLRSYAAEVGLDTDECLARYDRFRRSLMPTQIRDMRKKANPNLFLGESHSTHSFLKIAMILVVLSLIVGALVWLAFEGRLADESDGVAQRDEEIIVEPQDPVPTPGASREPSAEVNVRPSVLEVKANENITLLVRLDESAAQEVVVLKGESKSFDVYRQIEIRQLDAGQADLEYNGKRIEVAGPVLKLFNRYMFSE